MRAKPNVSIHRSRMLKRDADEFAGTLECYVFNSIWLKGLTQAASNRITKAVVEAFNRESRRNPSASRRLDR